MDESKRSLKETEETRGGKAENAEFSSSRPRKKPADATEDEHFFAWSVSNRDLSQLEFYKRVLEEAADESVPVLERLKFLAVFASNLDEFFMVRVSGLKEMLDIKDIQPMPGELAPTEQLKVIRERMLPMVADQVKCLHESVLPETCEFLADRRAVSDPRLTFERSLEVPQQHEIVEPPRLSFEFLKEIHSSREFGHPVCPYNGLRVPIRAGHRIISPRSTERTTVWVK